MRLVRTIVRLALFVALLTGVALVATPPRKFGAVTESFPPAVRLPLEGLATLISAAAAHPRAASVVVLLLVAPVAISTLWSMVPRQIRKDPQRLYSSDERRVGSQMSGDRCEGELFPFFRCRGGAEQGDHWFPHSKGGATSMENLVMLCAPCNRSKSARIPTLWQTLRITMRRRKYFPPNREPRPGQKYLDRVRW